MTEQVGYVGLGIMGRGMANNLLKAGFALRVWNRTASRIAMHSLHKLFGSSAVSAAPRRRAHGSGCASGEAAPLGAARRSQAW